MKTICSHMLVKNGMPFIGAVLRQVQPLMNRCIITISEQSDEATKKEVQKFKDDFGDQVVLRTENVKKPGELTQERQAMVDMTHENWILFLDDDDFWPRESIYKIRELINLNNNIDGIAVRPIQMIDDKNEDWDWRFKWFTKWFPNVDGLRFHQPWPRDIILINERPLYWRQNSRVIRVPHQYFHLSHIKERSFRNEDWAKKKWESGIGRPRPIPSDYLKYAEEIWKYK